MSINTDKYSATLRDRLIQPVHGRLLISRLGGSEQERDISEPVNCGGYGRIRHFRRKTTPGWPENSLPIDPACNALGLPKEDILRAQVFQNAGCNWRCWYCFVPFSLLNGSQKESSWFTATELVNLLLKEEPMPVVIDLSGGQPDLTPEWVPWMMRELNKRELSASTYLWSDDNLSNDYFWKYLSQSDIAEVVRYRNYGKVCCFKGFDAESFAFNTKADPHLFRQQFSLFKKYLNIGLDLFAYATFTAQKSDNLLQKMTRFVDMLQSMSPLLPLRTIPLEVRAFSQVSGRMNASHDNAFKIQKDAIDIWNSLLSERFCELDRARAIYEIPL